MGLPSCTPLICFWKYISALLAGKKKCIKDCRKTISRMLGRNSKKLCRMGLVKELSEESSKLVKENKQLSERCLSLFSQNHNHLPCMDLSFICGDTAPQRPMPKSDKIPLGKVLPPLFTSLGNLNFAHGPSP